MPLPGMDAPSFLSGTNDLPVTGPAPPSTPPPSTAAVFFADPAADPSRRPGSIHVRLGDAAVADGVTDGALEAELSRALAAFGTDIERFELYNKGSYVARPFAMVNFAAPLAQSEAARALLAGGAVEIFGQACGIKQRRAAKTQRKRHTEAADALARSEEARVAAARPAWQPHMLGLYPQRATTLDQNALVGQLGPPLLENLELYLRQQFPGSEEVARVLLGLGASHPTALRVKELFETVEAAAMIGREITAVSKKWRQQAKARAKAAKQRQRRPQQEAEAEAENAKGEGAAAAAAPPVEAAVGVGGVGGIGVIYDLACGHGLLGVLLAYRFAAARVVCVDLERRPGFQVFVDAFEAGGEQTAGSHGRGGPTSNRRVLPNLEFVVGDIVDVPIEPQRRSFVACVHGCNEVTSTAVQRAQAAEAAWAVMPCCIRDDIYCVQRTTRVADAQRYACMVGVLAGTYGATLVSAIPIAITNRNLCAFGGWERGRFDEGRVRGLGERKNGRRPQEEEEPDRQQQRQQHAS